MQQSNINNEVGAGTHVHIACAACKHQRKKCDDNCILAPYFPANKSREFQAVHKVFGVANVQRIVKFVESDEDRKRVADSLIWEALCRQKDPVLGPYGEYKKLLDELRLHKLHNFTAHTHTQQLQAPVNCKQINNNVISYANTDYVANTNTSINNTSSTGSARSSGPGIVSTAPNILRYACVNTSENGNDFVTNLSSYVFPQSTYYLQHPEKLIKQESHHHQHSPSLSAAIAPHAQFYYPSGQYNWQDNGK